MSLNDKIIKFQTYAHCLGTNSTFEDGLNRLWMVIL